VRRRLVAGLDQEHAADIAAVALGDPAGFPGRVEAVDEVGGDPRHQRLEAPVPGVFAGIEGAVAGDDPADVAVLRRAQQPGRGGGERLAVEQLLDRAHRGQELLPLGLGERLEQGGDAFLAVPVERGEGALAGGAEAQVQVPGVVRGALAADQLAFLQPAQKTAQVARVESRGRGRARRRWCGRGAPAPREGAIRRG
jgi:hypothetical protein